MKNIMLPRFVSLCIATALCSFAGTVAGQITLQQITNGLVDYYPLDYIVTNGTVITTYDVVGSRDMILVGMNGNNVVPSTHPTQNPLAISNCLYFSQSPSATLMYYDSKGQNQLDGSGDFLPFCNQFPATMNFWIKANADVSLSAWNDKRFFGECDDGSSAGASPLWLMGSRNPDSRVHFLFRQNTGSTNFESYDYLNPQTLADGTIQLPTFNSLWQQPNEYSAGHYLDQSWHMFTMTFDTNRVPDIYIDGVRDLGPGAVGGTNFFDAYGNATWGPAFPVTNVWYTTNVYGPAGVSNPPPNGYVRWVWNGMFKKGVTAFGGFRRQGGNSGGFPVYLDDIAFWNRRLSADEVQFVLTNGFSCPNCQPCSMMFLNSFTADFNEVRAGDGVTLHWNVAGYNHISISGIGDVSSLGPVGSTNVLIQNSTNFTLTVSSPPYCPGSTSTLAILVLPGVDPNWHLIQRFDGLFTNTVQNFRGGIFGSGWSSLNGSISFPVDAWNAATVTNSGAQNEVLTPRTGYFRDASSPTGFEARGALSYAKLGALTLPPGQSNTLFFRFSLQEVPTYAPGVCSDLDFGVGLSDESFIGPLSGLGNYLGTGGGAGPYFSILRNSGGAYNGGPFDLFAPDTADPADGNTAGSFSYIACVDPNGLNTNANYFVWMDILNRNTQAATNPGVSTNTLNQALYSVWLQKQGDATRTLLFSGFHGNRDYVNFNPVVDFPMPYLNKLFVNIGGESLVQHAAGAYFATNMIAVDDFYMSKTGFNGSIPKLLQLSSIIRNPGSVTITWYSLGSLFQTNTYTVQRKTSLNDPDWTTVANGVPSGGDTTSYTDPTGTDSAFYRIVWP